MLVSKLQMEIEKLKMENANLKSAPQTLSGFASPVLEAVVTPAESEPVNSSGGSCSGGRGRALTPLVLVPFFSFALMILEKL